MANKASLRRRLLALLMAALSSTAVVLAVATYFDTHRELDQLLDAHLAQSAQLLTQQAGHELLELEPLDDTQLASYAQKFAVQVWDREGKLMWRTSGAPSVRVSAVERGFSDAFITGQHWRVFSGWDREGQVLVQVAELHATRDRLAMQVALNSVWPLLLVLPIVAVLSGWLIGLGLQPLMQVGAEVSGRDSRNLEPLIVGSLPDEVRPLVERLNGLFVRIAKSLEGERRFTADAAHELRNPVAAIRAQAEAALQSTIPEAPRTALTHIVDSADRLARIVEQLLLLARLDQQTPSMNAAIELVALVRATLAELAPHWLAQGAELELDAPESVQVCGNGPLLQVVVRNLVENAALHGGARTRIIVKIVCDGNVTAISVLDNGPGITAQDREQLGRRFYRGEGVSTVGSGLGLSIVTRIAYLHGGELLVGPGLEGRGASVTMRWPMSPPP